MKEFKKSQLATAVVLGAAAGVVNAANVNPEGIGELLYIPYYSTVGNQETYFRLVNTSDMTVKVKLMFREGRTSQEVRDFNITLSPHDVWSGTVQANGTTGAKITTSDTSCTAPDKNKWTRNSNGSYSVDFVDNRGNANEGYIVARVMGVSEISTETLNSVPYLAKHINGVPRNCGAIDWAYANAFVSIQSQFKEPMNVLAGSAALIDAANGMATSIPVTVVANVNNPLGEDGLGGYGNNIVNVPNQESLENTADAHAVVFNGMTTERFEDDFSAGYKAVTAALMQNTVINSFDATTAQNSNWIVTFPTKRRHGVSTFDEPFPSNGQVEISPSYVDDEEIAFSATTDFSPADPVSTIRLPHEVNVLTFNGNNALGSALTTDLKLDGGVNKGWMQISFTNARPLVGTKHTFNGLPVIGFSYTEGSNTSVSTAHSYTKSIQ